jgi:hypothetical protein
VKNGKYRTRVQFPMDSTFLFMFKL